jgi:hypothetical protein
MLIGYAASRHRDKISHHNVTVSQRSVLTINTCSLLTALRGRLERVLVSKKPWRPAELEAGLIRALAREVMATAEATSKLHDRKPELAAAQEKYLVQLHRAGAADTSALGADRRLRCLGLRCRSRWSGCGRGHLASSAGHRHGPDPAGR